MKSHYPVLLCATLSLVPCLSRSAVIGGVTVTNGETPFSAGFPLANAVNGDSADYASQGKGADTFLEFAFGSPQNIDRIIVVSRDSAAPADWIGNFTLTFNGGATTSITRTGARGVSPIHSLGGVFSASSVRLDVDTTGSATAGGNTGAMEVIFMSPFVGKSPISGISILGSATPFNADFVATNAIDGLVGRSNAAGLKPEYASQGLGLGTFIDFDLGAIRPVSAFDFFDRPASPDRVTGFDMIFSQNATFGDVDDVLRSFTNSGMAMSAAFADTNARYVRYDVTASSGAGVNNGLSEILFYQTIPEPSAALCGLMALGSLLVRRRR